MPARLRGMLALVLLVISVDWITKGIAGSYYAEHVITNDKSVSLWATLAVTGGLTAYCWGMNSPLWTLGGGLGVGGTLANVMDRTLFGPVVDFIPAPLIPGSWYYNLADVAIAVGSGIIAYALLQYLRDAWRASPRPVMMPPPD